MDIYRKQQQQRCWGYDNGSLDIGHGDFKKACGKFKKNVTSFSCNLFTALEVH